MRLHFTLTAAALAIATAGCQVADTANNQVATVHSASDWPGFMQGFIDAGFKASPGFAVSQGKHEFDGQIQDYSAAAITAEVDRLKKAITDAEAFHADKLTKEQAFERAYLVAVAKGKLFWIDPAGADQPHTNPASYLGALDPSVYITVPYAAKEVRLKAYTKFLQNVPRAAE